jgi:RNA polymerase sigma-70 factor (ECF subfamily)
MPVVPDFGDDRDLVDGLRRRDEAALAWLLDTYDATMRRLAPADVVRDTWLAVLDGVDGFELRTTVRTWVFRTFFQRAGIRVPRAAATAPAFDPKRFRRGSGPTAGRWRKGAGPVAWRDDPARAATELAALPLGERVVVTLRDVDGWTAAEVGDVLDLAEGDQRVLLHQGRARIRQALEDQVA